MKQIKQVVAATLLLIISASCKKNKETQTDAVVLRASGNIETTINTFRNLVGPVLNTTTGVTGGRREINWDGIPIELMGRKLPLDFFNPVGDQAIVSRQRGLGYTDEGSFMVSASNFSEVNAASATEFAAFSGDKVFANTESSLWGIEFEVAGQHQPASVQGFGAVFADVDTEQSTFIEFFSGAVSKGKFYVPAQKSGSKFSFLGVYFKQTKITSVRIGHNGMLTGNTKDISQGGTHDLIVLDDLIYSEPVSLQ
ncbi:hypothetical protein [Lacibacter sediminis]|uniref:Uncharacterized protein n=1 Tax=Lacibacter sediminis TaxID=2760713 RepID=A0A7G5XF92_9BACT|nr:hypothetical protein [Lacibacter sediminis]QNA44145.1 hypothetical protein H4075_19055 [Lacibacter sediminis]